MSTDLTIPATITRAEVLELERQAMQMPQVEIPITHYFSAGVYARESHIPKGSCVTGKIHKYSNLNILSQGEMSVLTENGIKRVKAPFTVVSPPGTKRIAYTHTDCVWTTIHGTHETDLDRIEAEFTADSEQDYLAFCERTLTIEGA